MSSHYILVVQPQVKISAAHKKLLAKNIEKIGLQHSSGYEATRAAEELSSLPNVVHVILILVNETQVGVWKKGARS